MNGWICKVWIEGNPDNCWYWYSSESESREAMIDVYSRLGGSPDTRVQSVRKITMQDHSMLDSLTDNFRQLSNKELVALHLL